jgi:hypothetical protein
LAVSFRKGLSPRPKNNELIEYGKRAIIRTGAVESGDDIGKLRYLVGKYDKLIRATIPLVSRDKFYLMLSFDINSQATQIIEQKILKYIEKNKNSLI